MTDEFTSRLLEAIYTTLRYRIKPKVTANETLLYIDIILRMVELLKNRHTTLGADMLSLIASERDLLQEASYIFSSESDVDTQRLIAESFKGDIDEGSASIGELEATRAAIDETLCNIIPALFDKKQAGDEASSAVLRKLIDVNQRFFFSQDPEIKKGMQVLYRGGRLDDEPEPENSPTKLVEIDEQSLTRYLKRKFPESAGIHASNIYIVPGGFSKLTVFFDLHQDDLPVRQMALRKDMPISAIDTTVIDEYPLIEKVSKAGFPVATPYWLEQDAEHFSGAFFVSERIKGTNDISSWNEDPQAKRSFSRELARIMADLHRLDIKALGFPPEATAKSAGDHLEDEVRKYYKIYKEDSTASHPLLDFIFSWLLNNIPKHLFEMPPSIVHADIGFHNMLTDNGKIAALLDWEMSHLGDPAEDLYYSKLFIDQVSDWKTFIGFYEEFGGKDAPDSEFFYYVWMGARNAAGCCKLQDIFESILDKELKVALPAYIFGRRLEVDASAKIAERI